MSAFELGEVNSKPLINNNEEIHSVESVKTIRKQRPLTSEKDIYPHQCALEHSQYFKMKTFQSNRAIRKLILVSIVCFVFCGVETVGGLWSNSLAILTDAAHQFSDVAGFVISFIAVACSKRKASVKYSYGLHRADVLGALATVLIIWILLVWLLAEATKRLINSDQIQVDPRIMLVTSLIGFGCVVLNLVVLFCCCNEPKKNPEDEVEPHYVVDDLIARLKLGRGGLLARKSPGSGRSTPRGGQKIKDLPLHSINAEVGNDLHEVESDSST